MAANFEDLETQVLALDLDKRAALAEKLIRSLDTLAESEIERLWLEEAKRRRQQLLKGEVVATDGPGVLQQALASFA